MVLAHAVTPVSSGTTHHQDYRNRPAMGDRAFLPVATARPKASGKPRDQQPTDEQRQDPGPDPSPSAEANFAAALIAGGLPPAPNTVTELLRRIGSSEIALESQARLKDILA